MHEAMHINALLCFIEQVGTRDRIHVYYAHGQDNPNFVRRIYWLLEKYVMLKSYSAFQIFLPVGSFVLLV